VDLNAGQESNESWEQRRLFAVSAGSVHLAERLVTSPFGKVYAARHGITRGIPGLVCGTLIITCWENGAVSAVSYQLLHHYQRVK